MKLRPYQDEGVARVVDSMRRGKKRILLVLATGGGKTVVAAEIVRRALAKGTRVLFAAHRRELITQCVQKLVDAGIPLNDVGIIMAGFHPHSSCPVQVASVDTLRNREKPPARLIIIDESHRCLAPTYRNLVAYYQETGAVVLGLTATPYRADGGGLGEVYEDLVVLSTPSHLVADGFLVAPRVLSIPAAKQADLSGVHTRGNDYVESELAAAMDHTELLGNIVEHWQKHADGRRTVAFAASVAHSQHIAESFVSAGIPAEHLDGETAASERDAILARLSTGQTLVVANCGVLCEGWDQPAVKCCISARPTKSLGLWLQQAGRILRPWEGVGALILDHAGNAIVHGLPQETREFTLEPTPSKLVKRKTTRQCPKCDCVCPVRAKECPECGYVFPSSSRSVQEAREGVELTEVVVGTVQAMRDFWNRLLEEWEVFNRKALEYGSKPRLPGWVYHRFRAQYTCRPPSGCRLPIEQATDETKDAALREYRTTAEVKGYKPGWAAFRFYERFGHWPRPL